MAFVEKFLSVEEARASADRACVNESEVRALGADLRSEFADLLRTQFDDDFGLIAVALSGSERWALNPYSAWVHQPGRERRKVGPGVLRCIHAWCEKEWGRPGVFGSWHTGSLKKADQFGHGHDGYFYFQTERMRAAFIGRWNRTVPSGCRPQSPRR